MSSPFSKYMFKFQDSFLLQIRNVRLVTSKLGLNPLSFLDYFLIAPVLEEAVKSVSLPWAGITFGLVEYFTKLIMGHNPVVAFPALLFHIMSSRIQSYRTRVILHSAFNMFAITTLVACNMVGCVNLTPVTSTLFSTSMLMQNNPLRNLPNYWALQKEKLETVERIKLAEIDYPAGNYPFEEEEAKVVRKTACYVPVATCPDMQVIGTFIGDPLELDDKTSHFMLPTNAPMFVPGNTDHNKTTGLRNRILVSPPQDPETQLENWLEVIPLIYDIFPKEPISYAHEVWKDAWLEKFPSLKKKKYLSLDKRNLEICVEESIPGGTDLMPKLDEAISKFDSVNQEFYCKPRMIAVVNPIVQYFVGPIIYGLTQTLKEHWGLTNHCCLAPNGWTIKMTWGSGRTDAGLTEWMHHALRPSFKTIFIIVAGDDGLIIINDDGKLTFIEGDAGMFDQSQSFGPLRAQGAYMQYMGCPKYFTDILLQVACSPYKLTYKDKSRIKVKRETRPIRDTGGPDTTFGNTGNMGCANFLFFREWDGSYLNLLDNLLAHFEHLGFDMKLKIRYSPSTVTFLKGTWYKTKEGDFDYVWGPLPSQIIKIGKSYRNPSEFYPHKTYAEACETFLHDQGAGLRRFLQVPVLRAYVKRWGQGKAAKAEEWQISASDRFGTTELDVEAMMEFMAERYFVSPHELREVEEMVEQTTVFTFMVHPVFLKLCLGDYAAGAALSHF